MPSFQSVTQTAVSNSSGLSKCSSRSLIDSASSLGVLVSPPVLILSLLLVQSIRTNIRNTERACLSAACNYSITVLTVVFKRAVFYVFSSLYLMFFSSPPWQYLFLHWSGTISCFLMAGASSCVPESCTRRPARIPAVSHWCFYFPSSLLIKGSCSLHHQGHRLTHFWELLRNLSPLQVFSDPEPTADVGKHAFHSNRNGNTPVRFAFKCCTVLY